MGHKEHHRMDNFYPRPPRGGRRHGQVSQGNRKNFYPRPPRGGRRPQNGEGEQESIFLSTPSARRATHPGVLLQRPGTISIHALREEGDWSISAPRCADIRFLSTPSARRATHLRRCAEDALKISIHALREEGDVFPPAGAFVQKISIHALREEGDARPRRSL